MNDLYQSFVDKIISGLGFENLPEEKKKEVVEVLKQRMDQKILLTIMSNLKDEDVKELDKLVEKGMPTEEIVNFMSSKIENLDDKITEALGNLYEQMVVDTKAIARSLS